MRAAKPCSRGPTEWPGRKPERYPGSSTAPMAKPCRQCRAAMACRCGVSLPRSLNPMEASSSFIEAKAAVGKARSIAVLTGAGVSAESGIPTFRSNGGFWGNMRFQDLATPEGFNRDPKPVWEWYESRRHDLLKAEPNAGHRALAELERRVERFTLIT